MWKLCCIFWQEGKEFAESKRLLFMEASAKLNHQVTEVFSAVGEWWGPQESRGAGGGAQLWLHFWALLSGVLGADRVSPGARTWWLCANAREGGDPGQSGGPLPDPPSLPFAARELLQREERKEGRPQRREAGQALSGAPAGQARCCPH